MKDRLAMSIILGPDGTPLSSNSTPALLGANGTPTTVESFAEYTAEELHAFIIFIEQLLQAGHETQNVVAIALSELGRMARTMQMAFEEYRADWADPCDPTLDGTVEGSCCEDKENQRIDHDTGKVECVSCGSVVGDVSDPEPEEPELDDNSTRDGWPDTISEEEKKALVDLGFPAPPSLVRVELEP
jgi:hypothetical protein